MASPSAARSGPARSASTRSRSSRARRSGIGSSWRGPTPSATPSACGSRTEQEEERMLHMNGVSKVYRTAMVETHALRELTLEVRAGELVAVTGPSGSGKTTFLNIAGLLEELTRGEYLLDGVDVRRLDDRARSRLRNEKIGFVFQSFNLIPDLDLFDNVDVPLRYRGLGRRERRRRIEGA